MKTWLILLGALLIPLTSSHASTVQDGVIIQKTGATYLFVFPPSEGRLRTNQNPAGKITVGSTVTVAYALKIIKGGRARFIGIDASKIPPDVFETLKVALKVVSAPKPFGFLVRDTRQPNIDITISPKFMAKVRDKVRLNEKIAREGNLNVTLAPDAKGFRVVKVYLN